MRLRRTSVALLLSLLTVSALAAERRELPPQKPSPPSLIRKIKGILQSLDVYISPPRP